jgi:hypothetical protein
MKLKERRPTSVLENKEIYKDYTGYLKQTEDGNSTKGHSLFSAPTTLLKSDFSNVNPAFNAANPMPTPITPITASPC